MALQIGDKAPEILGVDQNGKEVKLSQFKGKSWFFTSIPKIIPVAVRRRLVAFVTDIKNCRRLVMKYWV